MIIEFVSAKLGGRCEVGLTALREELSATQSERERERERGEGGECVLFYSILCQFQLQT